MYIDCQDSLKAYAIFILLNKKRRFCFDDCSKLQMSKSTTGTVDKVNDNKLIAIKNTTKITRKLL